MAQAKRASIVLRGLVTLLTVALCLGCGDKPEAAKRIKAAEADANRTAVDLQHTVLNAPISGRIDRAFVTPGNLLTGGRTTASC